MPSIPVFFVFYLTVEIEKLNEPKLLDFLAVSSTSSMENKTRDNDFVPNGSCCNMGITAQSPVID